MSKDRLTPKQQHFRQLLADFRAHKRGFSWEEIAQGYEAAAQNQREAAGKRHMLIAAPREVWLASAKLDQDRADEIRRCLRREGNR